MDNRTSQPNEQNLNSSPSDAKEELKGDLSSNSIQMTQIHVSNQNESPDSQGTAPLSDIESLDPIELFRNDISKRIVRNHKLIYKVNLPEINDDNLEEYKFTSIITRDGLHQLDSNFEKWQLILTAERLSGILPSISNNTVLSERDDDLVYDDLTLEELNSLEREIKDHHGRSIIGYSINETVFLTAIGLGRYEFPPKPEDYPAQVLNLINKPIVRDISLSVRSAAQALLLFAFFIEGYLQYDTKNEEFTDSFYFKNILWFLVVTAAVMSISIALLRSPLLDKVKMFALINRVMLIEKSMLSISQNWMTYGSLIIPTKIVGYGIILMMLYGFINGYYDKNELYRTSVINVARRTALKTFWHGISYALTTGTFISKGLKFLTSDIVFAKHTNDDAHSFAIYYRDLSIIQYTACSLAFLCHLARYPNASNSIQRYGRYASNISNSAGYVMLDNYAIFQMISMVFGVTVGENIYPDQKGILTAFYGLQLLTFIYTILTAFPTTPDLPEFSMDINLASPTLFSTCIENLERLKGVLKITNTQTEQVSSDIEMCNVVEKKENHKVRSIFGFFTNEHSSNVDNPIHMEKGIASLRNAN